jgi:hypothetical protein
MVKSIPGEGSIIERRRALTADRLQRIEHYATERGMLGDPVRPIDLVRDLDVSTPTVAAKLLAVLEAQGKLDRLALRDGWLAPNADAAPPTCTLDDLLVLAQAHTSDDAVARKGRQADDVNRDVWALTSGQFEDIERLVALIRRHTTEATPPARLQPTDLMWDETADGGRGGWGIQRRVKEWAELEHRSAHETRSRPERWSPKLAGATVSKLRGAANNLLFLAATHGLVPRSPRNTGGLSHTYDPAWTPIIERWTRWIVLHAKASNHGRVTAGAKVLARYASRLGYRDVAHADWSAVRETIVADHSAGCLTLNAFLAARYAYRFAWAGILRRLGVQLDEGDTDRLGWRTAADDRITLVPQSALDAAAVVDVSMSRRDFSGWQMLDGRFPSAFVDGYYGLRAWAAWSTVRTSHLASHQPPLPPRVWKEMPTARRRRRMNRVPLRCSAATLAGRFRMLAHIAGYATTTLGMDWAQNDLEALCDPRMIDSYVCWSEDRPADGRGDRHATLRQTVLTVAWLVNGFLQARAGQQLAEAEGKADSAAMTAAHERIERFTRWYRLLEAKVGEMAEPRHTKPEEVAAHIVAIAEGWRGADQVDGLHKIDRLVDCLVNVAVSEGGGLSLDEQYTRIRAGAWAPTDAWARAIRLATLLVVLQRIPLRGRTCSDLTLSAWQNSAVAGGPSIPQRWEGAIRLEVSGSLMKGRRAFKPALILPRDVGSPGAERGLRREVLCLWFCDGGARDHCRTALDPVTGRHVRYDVDWLFPDLLRDPEPRRPSALRPRTAVKRVAADRAAADFGQWRRSAISDAFRAAVICHAQVLCVDVRHLKRLYGALRIHTVRRLFGSYWAPRRLIETSRLLDHRDPVFTAARYCAQDERTMSLYI